MRSRFLILSLFLVALLVPLHSALAAWPDKPIRIVVPAASGSAADVLTRALSLQLSRQLGVPIMIDNKPGGAYVIGTMEVVRSAPDGYTLGYGNVISLATNRSLLSKVPYDQETDLTLISTTLRVNNFLVVNNDVPARTVPELIAYAKQNPGKLAFASDGNGTTSHLGMELFKSMTGTNIVHVPYKAAVSGVTELMSGLVQMMMVNIPVVATHVQSGHVRALGITAPNRSAAYPDVPTIAESVPGFEVVAWGGLVGPAKLPQEIVTRLNDEVRKALAHPAVLEQYKSLGATASPSTPQEFRELSRRESDRWARIIKTSGAKIN